MDVQRLAVGIVVDAAEGEVLQLEPDIMRRRDQARWPVDGGEMPDREQCQREGDRKQRGFDARRPLGCRRLRRSGTCLAVVMAGHSRPKDGVASDRLCPAIHVFASAGR